jgi:hypothetical protein
MRKRATYLTDFLLLLLRIQLRIFHAIALKDTEQYFLDHRMRGCFSRTEDRKRRTYDNYLDDPLIWSHSVMGTGSWYNNHKHIMNHTTETRYSKPETSSTLSSNNTNSCS